MRLVSQDGMNGIYDISYEKCLIYIYGDKKTIKVQPLGEVDSEYVFATYSTEAKAIKVMEMLREHYFYNKHEETYRDGVFSYAPNFKFPTDEEVEV